MSSAEGDLPWMEKVAYPWRGLVGGVQVEVGRRGGLPLAGAARRGVKEMENNLQTDSLPFKVISALRAKQVEGQMVCSFVWGRGLTPGQRKVPGNGRGKS